MSDEAPKRRGRPPKSPEEKKGGNLTFRTRADLRQLLEEAAGKTRRSISEEVEHRLVNSFEWERTLGDVQAVNKLARQNIAAAAGRAGWQSQWTPYGRVWLEPREGTPEPQDQWQHPDEIKPTAQAPEPVRPVATVDLRSLIEETVERTIQRLGVTSFEADPEYAEFLDRRRGSLLERGVPRSELPGASLADYIEWKALKAQVDAEEASRAPRINSDEPVQDGQPAKGAKHRVE